MAKKQSDPWKVPARKPTPGKYLMGPEFPGCVNTGTRPILYQLHKQNQHGGQRFVVCHECDYRQVQTVVATGGATGKRHLKRRAGWHGDAWVFKTRAGAVAQFETWCRQLAGQYDGMRRRAAELRAVLRDQPGTAAAAAAALELSDLGI
jgi:hypothetical protein